MTINLEERWMLQKEAADLLGKHSSTLARWAEDRDENGIVEISGVPVEVVEFGINRLFERAAIKEVHRKLSSGASGSKAPPDRDSA